MLITPPHGIHCICNVEEKTVESKEEMEAIGVATSGTDIDQYV